MLVLLFVFWYCHKRGRETRLEKERLAAESSDAGTPAIVLTPGGPDSGVTSSASSINKTDDDSIFGDSNKRQKTQATSEPVPREGDATEPLMIKDDKEKASVNDLPDVTHLPDPVAVEKK